VGSLKFIDAAHRVSDVEMKFAKMTAQQGKKNLFSLPGWLIHHAPVLYCVHIWNNYIQQQG
jgi:hypothetical protein